MERMLDRQWPTAISISSRKRRTTKEGWSVRTDCLHEPKKIWPVRLKNIVAVSSKVQPERLMILKTFMVNRDSDLKNTSLF